MKYIMLILLYLLISPVQADNIETIQLHHRLADEVLPQILPFLPKDTIARAYGDKIIIKTDNATLEEVKHLLSQIDVPQQSLIVSVMKTNQTLDELNHQQTSLSLKTGEHNEADVTIKHFSTRDNNNKNQLYKAFGITDHPISISLGQDIPLQDRLLVIGREGQVGIQTHSQYISLNSGFQALSHLLPHGKVRVEIHPLFSQQQKQNNQLEHGSIQSTVVGNLGEWIELGLIAERQEIEQQDVQHYRSHQQEQQRIYLKVELAPANK